MQIRRTPTSRRFSAVGILAAALFTAASPAMHAQTICVWAGGTDNWSQGAEWSVDFPNSVNSDARVDNGKTGIPSVVFVDGTFSVGRLVVDINDRIVINNYHFLGINSGAFANSGALINNGFVDVGAPDAQGNLRFNGTTSLIGTGVMTLHGDARVPTNGTFTNYSTIQGDTSASLGDGEGEGRFINATEGVIDANTPGKKLYMSPNGNPGGLINFGTIRATNGGILAISASTYTGADAGTLTAFDGSEVRFGEASTIAGGTLATVGTGVIRSTSNLNANYLALDTFTNAGAFIFDPNTNTYVAAGATITNNGNMTFNGGTGVGTASLQLIGNATLTGTGTLTLQGTTQVSTRTSAHGPLTNQSTIQGDTDSGTLGADFIAIVNHGLINANVSGKTLILDPSAEGLTNNGGTLRASGGGILRLTTNGSYDNTGGTIEALDGGSIIYDNGTVLANNQNGTLTGGIYRATGPGAVVNLPGPVPTALAGGAQIIEANGGRVLFGGQPVAPAVPVVTVVAAMPTATVGGAPGVVAFSIPTALPTNLKISYTVKGKAVNGVDYAYLKGTTKIKAGATTKALKIQAQGDLGGAAKKTIKLTLLPDDGYQVSEPATIKLKIIGEQ